MQDKKKKKTISGYIVVQLWKIKAKRQFSKKLEKKKIHHIEGNNKNDANLSFRNNKIHL